MRRVFHFVRLVVVTIIAAFLFHYDHVHASLDRLRRYQRECFDNVIPCVMFLDDKQAYGCAQCGDDVRTDIVREFKSVVDVERFLSPDNDRRILMMPEHVFFFTEVLSALQTATNVAAVIVYEATIDANGEDVLFPRIIGTEVSADRLEPNQDQNYYPAASAEVEAGTSPSPSFARNSAGRNNKFSLFPFNVFHVNATVAKRIQEKIERFPPRDGPATVQKDIQPRSKTSPRYKAQSRGQMYACPSIPASTPAPNDDDNDAASGVSEFASQKNSRICLEEETCLPIGGQSVWSALEHISSDPPNNERKILAITAPMDSLAFFPELALGASAEIASLAVLMAVAQAVSEYRRKPAVKDQEMSWQPVYFVWNAQSWGYTGSARFLKDVKEFSCDKPNDASKFEKGCRDPFMDSLKFQDFQGAKFTVLNIGQLVTPEFSASNAPESSSFQFYKQGGLEQRDAGGDLEEALDAAFGNIESVTLDDGLRQLTPIDASQSFRRYVPDAEVITVTSYEKTFTNTLYHSMYDNETLIKSKEPLYAVATAIANAVVSLAFDPTTQAEPVNLNRTVIDQVLTCMTGRGLWVGCELAREYLGGFYQEVNGSVMPGNYPGSFFPSTRLADTNPSGSAKLSFIRSFLAYHNRYDVEEEEVKCSTVQQDEQDCKEFIQNVNERVQAGNHSQLRTAFCTRGKCVASDTYTHNAFGAALDSLNAEQTKFVYRNETDSAPERQPEEVAVGSTPPEAAWTESFWDGELGLCGFVEDTPLFGGLILGAGVFVLFLSLGVVYWFNKQLKAGSRTEGQISIAVGSPMWTQS